MLKTPLKALDWVFYSVILDADNHQVVSTVSTEQVIEHHAEIAAEIVQRCNAHDKLLEVLDAAHEYLTDHAANMDVNGNSINAELALLLVQLEQALALAEGESSDTSQSS